MEGADRLALFLGGEDEAFADIEHIHSATHPLGLLPMGSSRITSIISSEA